MRAPSRVTAADRRSGLLSVIILMALSVYLTACGGGGSTAEVTTSAATVASVSIDQTGLVLTALGESSQLSATAYDVDGNALDVPVTWSSTTPADIGVDGTGLVTANTTTGSSQIVAEAAGVRSAPLLVVATVLPAGAVALTDAQIVGEPFTTDSVAAASAVTTSGIDLDTPASIDNTYQVVLTRIEPPAIGALLISTGSKAVAGRVLAVEVDGGRMTVTLGLASVRELFPNLNIEQVVDIANAEVLLPPDIAALYAVERVGDSYTFTPKPTDESVAVTAMAKPAAAGAPLGTHALPPFSECSTSLTGLGGALPISLSAPPVISVTATPTLDMLVTPGNGVERFLVKAEPTIKFEGGVTVTAAFEGKIECAVDLFVWRIPVGGALSFVFGGVVPVGVGMEVGGKLTVATAGVGTDVTVSSKAQVGLVCPGGSNCDATGSWGEATAKVNPKLDAPGLGDLRLEPSLFAFGRLELQIGNPFLKKLRFEAVKAKAGGKLQGSFAAQASQIIDTSYKSDYKASAELTAEAGLELGEVIKLLGLTSANALQFGITKDLGTSPVGSVSADRTTFANGDTVNFKVTLDAGAIEFIPGVGPYNVNAILLVRSVPGDLTPTEVARVPALQGETEFSIPFTATDSGSASEFTAFVVTSLVPLDVFALEVGAPAKQPEGKIVYSSARSGNFEICTMNPDGTALAQLTHSEIVNDFFPTWSPGAAKIAFQSTNDAGLSDVFVMNADGSGVTNLTNEMLGGSFRPSWSRDGNRIAFARYVTSDNDHSIYVVNANGSGMTRLTDDGGLSDDYPSWSPDGSKIVFTRLPASGEWEIWVMNADGSGQVKLANGIGHTEFSPDGTRIAFSDSHGISVMNADGSGQIRLTSNERDLHPTWSPDGARIAFESDRDLANASEIFIMNADGSGLIKITNDLGNSGSPAWSR